MPTFFDLQRYAATGIASPDMTAFDKMRALAAFGGSTVQTLTGIPPLTFKADGSPLISWSMLGNGSQTGTPTPDNPVMPTFCGVRTGNLFDKSTAVIGERVYQNRVEANENAAHSDYIDVTGISTLTINKKYSDSTNFYFYADKTNTSIGYVNDFTANVPTGAKYCRINVIKNDVDTIMLNSGDTALPYEPFGYKIPITCAGQTVPVYLGQVSTVRRVGKCVLTGEEDYNRYDANRHVFRVTTESTGISRLPSTSGICSHFEQIGSQSDLTNGQFAFGSSYVYFRMDSITSNSDFIEYIRDQYAAGTPVTVWYVLATEHTGIVNEPLAKIGDYADELHSEDAGVTIPTVKGQNTLTVDTELQPSGVSITGRIKAV